MSELRSALFIDFDNVFLGLRELDPKAAESFATNPRMWLDWLASGGERQGEPRRRFLVLLCYLNPRSFGQYRPFFTQSGFRVVDCPPLTASGKTSADIYMVLDILDTLAHPTRYEEFVIASADADFTPVVQRLRANDRLSTLVTAGPASIAYRSVSDSIVFPDQLVDVLTHEVVDAVEEDSEVGNDQRDGESSEGDLPDFVYEQTAKTAAAAIREGVSRAEGPVQAPAVAHLAQAASPTVLETRWAGSGSFGAFLSKHVPELVFARRPAPGYLFDPERHSEADLPGDSESSVGLDGTPARVARVTGASPITGNQYRLLFEQLAVAMGEGVYSRNELSKVVRDRTAAGGERVPRNAVNFVIQGLLYSGFGLPANATAEVLSRAFLKNVLALCDNAELQLSEPEVLEVTRWLTGRDSIADDQPDEASA